MPVITAEQAIEEAKDLDFNKVWAALMETRTHIEQMTERADKNFEIAAQSIAEMSARAEKTDKNFEKSMEKIEKINANLGGLNRSMGALIETLLAARLWEKFEGYPYNLKRAYQRVPIYDEKNHIRTDIDILLSDTEWCMAVEVKWELNRKDDIDDHIVRMGLIRKYPPAETLNKKLVGAMAGGVVNPDVRDYAHKAGFYTLELTGESVTLIKPPEGFTAKEW
jgi:hypothetical protein